MGNILNKESWLGRTQMKYVEDLAWWNGVLSRKELVDHFRISGQQATAVLQAYQEVNPKCMEYSLNVRRYLASPKMKREISPASFEEQLSIEDDLFGRVNIPVREVSDKVYRYLMVAVKNDRYVTMTYQSKSSSSPEKRKIIPKAFGYDGVRYHVRAWCTKREGYVDFSLLRIKDIKWPTEQVDIELEEDADWNEIITVKFRINPKASEGTKLALIEDYGLSSEDDCIEIECRKAMQSYVLFRMGLDADLPNTAFFERV